MKLVRVLLITMLVVSVVLNLALYRRNERLRPQFTVNGRTFSKREYHDWMEQHFGIATQATMIMSYLVADAAKKAGVMPTEADVQQYIQEQIDANPELAERVKNPITKGDVEMQARDALTLFNLATKDIKPSEAELKSYYETAGSNRFDVQESVLVRVFTARQDPKDPQKAGQDLERAKAIIDAMGERIPLQKVSADTEQKPLTDLSNLRSSMPPGMTLQQLPITQGNPALQLLNGVQVGQSKIVQQSQGAVLCYVERRTHGRKTSFSDPAIRKKVERDYKATRQTNLIELKRKLWDEATITTDPESEKPKVEQVIFGAASKSAANG